MSATSARPSFLALVAETIRRNRLLEESGRVVVALSGGADSVATLLALKELGYAVEAAHCNFHLRGEDADADEGFVVGLCRRNDIPLHVRDFQTAEYAKEKGISIEMAARELRYDWFATFDCDVATGHHLDDNAETLLLNLVRGTGITGLAAMRVRNGRTVRPLLHVSREEIETFLRERGQAFRTDATNGETIFRRNKIRHEVLPLLADINPNILRSLHATALRLREAEGLYQDGVGLWRAKCVTERADGFTISLPRLREATAPGTLLHEWLSPLGFHEPQQLLNARDGVLTEGKGFLATVHGETIEVRRVPKPDLTLTSLRIERLTREELGAIPRTADTACLDEDKIVGRLSLRCPQQGDRFQPFGMQGRQLVSDFLTNRHASRIDKLATRLLCDEAGILWVVGQRIAARAAITEETQRILRITCSSSEQKTSN